MFRVAEAVTEVAARPELTNTEIIVIVVAGVFALLGLAALYLKNKKKR